ncbi:insulin-like peptide INSL5 [Terrapene carolina triunguis]|uniref:insulin-like peptide INSL5 n=1 Tax=Terrapene triunguis TaxID=2587831 RepID=UPI000CEFB6BE|nr:insulin-like peptide INSL5 [Terrapene carolina triunguis]
MKGAIQGLVLISLLIAVSDVKGEENFMKLCGREFIRAVVFTCGGSRWRRHLIYDPQDLFEDRKSHLHLPRENSDSTEPLEYGIQNLEPMREETLNNKPQSQRDLRGTRQKSIQERREVVSLLTTSCCSIGCSEKDISSLC